MAKPPPIIEKMKVSIVVPAHNEEGNIPQLVERIAELIRSNTGYEYELLLVDDGSTDNTHQVMLKCQAQHEFIKVIHHRNVRGITHALFSGFERASGEYYLFFPADLQYAPEEIPKLLEPLNRGADIVTGWKTGHYHRAFVSTVYNSLSRWLFKLPIHDLNSVKAFRREVVDALPLRRDWHRYMVALAAQEGYRIEEVRVNIYPRSWGRSKFGFWRIPIGILDLLAVKFHISFSKRPMLLFGSAGGASILLGIIAGLVALYYRIFLHQGHRALLYLVILLILAGLSLFALGLLAEAIAGVEERISRLERTIPKRSP